ncbi:hypothetical protein MMC07_001839 [Pseudocyphellaria aurata]|nr:hypothetical protein [Pseudocyphellaria aurata]
MEEDFRSWFLLHGGALHPEINIDSDSDGYFIRMCDEQDLLPGARVISCPHTLIISWLKAVQDPFLGQLDLQSVSPLINQLVISRIFLMEQFLLREQSLWWPYIRMLPQPDALHTFNSPLCYGPEDLAWIRGTNLEFGAQRMESKWRQEYEEATSLFKSRGSEQVDTWSWPIYKWAAVVFTSRSFPGSALANSTERVANTLDLDCPVLIPGVDFLNHNPLAKVTWLWGHSECSIINGDTIGRSTQIWNNYGPKSNEQCESNSVSMFEAFQRLTFGSLVILGYGFSLFRNPADFCSLAISLDVEKRISTIKKSQLGTTLTEIPATGRLNEETNQISTGIEHAVDMNELAEGHSNFNMSKSNFGNADAQNQKISAQRINRDIKWVRCKGVSLKNDFQVLYEFSPGFLGDCSIAFANERELAEADFQLHSSVDFSTSQFSRNKVHVMCAVTMILQRQQMAITKHDLDLPLWPANQKQFHAARYRRNQLQILDSVTRMLLESIKSLPGLSMIITRDIRVVRLENILTNSATSILTDFRAALNAGLGTRNPTKIRKNGWVECAFTLWLCGLCTRYSSNIREDACSTSNLPPNLSRWLIFLNRVYGTPPKSGPHTEHAVNPVKYDSQETCCTGIMISEQSCDETQLLCESFLAVIHAAVTRNPRSLYEDRDVTILYLRWCLNIIRQEGVMCPDLEGRIGEETDEYILILEYTGTT